MSKQTRRQPYPTEDDNTLTVTIMLIGGIIFAVAVVALFLLTHSAGWLG